MGKVGSFLNRPQSAAIGRNTDAIDTTATPTESASARGIWLVKRRGRDSNPRWTEMAHNGFRDRRIQPLCHPSEMAFSG
jgi:hypothetical protein